MRDYAAWARFMLERQAVPFAWGPEGQDCIRLAANAVEALTGRNWLPDAAWSTELGARRLLKRMGGIEAVVSARLNTIAPALALRGDVGAIEDPDLGLMLAVIEGETLALPGERGLCRTYRRDLVRAWSAEA